MADFDSPWKEALEEYLEERNMPYITSIERMTRAEGREEGREEGQRDLVRRAIERRFGHVPPYLRNGLRAPTPRT